MKLLEIDLSYLIFLKLEVGEVDLAAQFDLVHVGVFLVADPERFVHQADVVVISVRRVEVDE